MGRGRSFPQQFVNRTYVCVCVVLVLLSFVFTPLANLGKDSTSAASPALSPPPEGNGYTYSRGIAINHSQVPSDQSNFPVLISGTYSYLATVANGGRVQNSNGYDIIFTSDSGCATKLNHEVETYNATNGAVNYWVKVPMVSHASDTTIYMCYGNSSITTDQSNKTGVWDANYKGVWHLPNGSNLTTNDSTSNANNGTISGAVAATGRADGGGNFNGSSDYVDVKAGKVDSSATTGTVSAWVKISTLDTNGTVLGYGGAAGTNVACWGVYIRQVSGNRYFAAAGRATDGGTYNTVRGGTVLAADTWYYVTYSSNGSAWKIRLNGATAESLTAVLGTNTGQWIGDITPTTPDKSVIGGTYAGGSYSSANFWHGILDEVRISNTERSDDWVTTEYNNQSSPATFYTISTASGNQPPVANAGGTYTGITGTAVSFNGSSSSDPDGTVASYSWTFGDSASGSGATPTHTYATAGTYTVTLTVTDNLGATNSASTTATISNRPPIANAGGTYTGVTGTAVQYSGSSSSDPDGTIASYSWSFGDSNSGTGATPAHTYATAGSYTVTLTVTDNLGATNSATTTATISNRPPVANAGGPYSSTTGTAVQLSGTSSSDPDGTIASYSWNFGDNSSGSGSTPTHTYATAGTFTVTLTVTDNLGATASATASTTVTGTLDARLDPLNRTGGGGEDPLSRNFNWSIPLVGLPGRAGLDLGLSLSYNSLATWTRNGNAISFDDDHGSPAPGFRLGFPVIQGSFYNSQAGKYSFIMITPSGSRLELRQVGTSTKYQSVDSSYVLLDASTMKLRTTDGTQLSYAWKGSDYECTEIKDRNGNFITINYDGLSRVATVKDTLSRTITFNYDTNGSLSTITQSWTVNGQTLVHPWATFAYTDKEIQTNFTNLTVYGPQNNSTIHALTQVKLADDSHFDFDYTSWGQVWKISQYTGETSAHLLNYRSYDLPMTAGTALAQTDCPRFTVRHDWAENWNRDANGTAQEVNTSYAAPVDAALPDNSLATVTRTKVTSADGTYQQIYFAGNIAGGAGSAPAWKRGLPLLTDTFESGNTTPQRSATTTWTQDDTSIAYQLNPRVTETNITDPANNHARTRTDYASTSLSDGTTVNLPVDTYEYQSNATTVLRRTHIVYNVDTSYTGLRIIGLPSAKYLCDGAQGEVPCNNDSGASLFSKVTFEYDESGSILGTDAPVQHNTDDTPSFRGNLSSVTRHDVVNTSQSTTSTFKYNTAGAVVATLDPLNHGVTVSYADSFSDDNNSRNTLAYPTTVTDAGGFSSSMKYNYDFGAATRKQTPLPNVTDNEPGPVQTIEYDSLGRLQKVKSLFNNAYTRYEYPASQTRVDTYATIQDNAGEAHSFKITDGHGRVIASASDHPGSTGGFSGQLSYYDLMGRTVKSSNPTETSASSTSGNPYDWSAIGDDASWIYTQQTYDWKGRPLVTTNPSTTGNPADTTTKTASYGGCGCAGGEIVTLTDETTRRQKVYSDVLGRQWKTEVLNLDGTVYSTTTSTFNVRDQVKLLRQFQGVAPTDPNDLSCPSGGCQQTTMTYDGYGRLQTKHVPEQNASTATVYAYNTDDTVQSVTDARGASATYTYNARHLVTGISYSAPVGITPTSNVSITYDATGNRTSMTDGLGNKSYVYDQLSRMASESRYISDLGQFFSLNYQYNLAGELTSITDPFNAQVGYNHDNTGRVSGVTGAGYANVSTYASNLQYRAWGATKHLDYGNSLKLDLAYNDRLLNTQFDVTNSGGSRVAGWQYQYGSDGRLSYSHDLRDDRLDRAYIYNQSAQLAQGISGSEARGNNVYPYTGPYKQTYFFDVWGNLTDRSMRIHGYMGYPSTSYYHDNYVNNRNTGGDSQPWIYDEDGRITNDRTRQYSFDAAGNQTYNSQNGIYRSFDGDGELLKKIENGAVIYSLQSSVVGEVINELNQFGQKQRGYVYRDGEVLAKQEGGQILWNHDEPSGTSSQWSNASGATSNRVETDPLGTQVDENGGFSGGGFSSNPIGFYGNANNMGGGCAAGSAGVFCTGVLNYRGGLAWQSMLTFGFAQTTTQTRIGTKQVFNPRWETIFDMRKTVKYEYTQVVTTYVFLGGLFSNSWMPPVGPDPPQNSGEQLTPCLRGVLRQFFPSQSAQGKSYSPIDDARFKAGIPFPISLDEPQASTLGLLDIHYDPSQVTLDHGDFESLKTIVEEVSHTVQFLQVWAGLKKNMMAMGKWGMDTTTYNFAQDQWLENYSYYATKGKVQNGDSYKNDVEKWAKNSTFDILSQVRGDPKLSAQVEKCGFKLNGDLKRPDY